MSIHKPLRSYMARMARAVLLAALLFPAIPAAAQQPPPAFLMPVSCEPGRDCWIVNYVDTDPGPGSVDYKCGPQSYDDHRGTDFALRDMTAMRQGTDVLAAAGGTVLRVRDGVADFLPGDEEREAMLAQNKGCGNGVVIDHGGGWQTIYCHLKQGSLVVKANQKVTPGQKIAQIGHSGASEFPHLHFGIFHNGRTIDPFTGADADSGAGCDAPENTMWLPGMHLPYEPVTIAAAGFHDDTPLYEDILENAAQPDSIETDAPILSFWVLLYAVAPGDRITLTMAGPDGTVIAQQGLTQERHRARQFYYIGKRNDGRLPPGPYSGTVTVERMINGQNFTRTRGRAVYVQ